MRFKKKTEEDLFISVTPLVDIVLVCLIFFMITYHFDIVSGARIDLPNVENKNTEDEANKITLIVSKSGEIYLGGERLDQKGLDKALKALVSEKGSLRLILQADKDVTHGKVVEIMDVAKGAGIDSIVIAAKWKSGKVQ
jgi:biopolymer transport protein ExbD